MSKIKKIMSTDKDYKEYIGQGRFDEAIAELDSLLGEAGLPVARRADLLVARGKAWWSLGDRRKALNDYEEAAQLDPSGPGRALVEHTMSILDFYDTTLYNP